jgi:hypothetical protein
MPFTVMLTDVAELQKAVNWSLLVALAALPLLFITIEQLKAMVSLAAKLIPLMMSWDVASLSPSGLILTVTVFALAVVLVRTICLTIVVVFTGTV